MKLTLCTALVLSGLLLPGMSQALTKCTDPQGKVTYQDGACSTGSASAGVRPAAAPTAPVLLTTRPGAVVIDNPPGSKVIVRWWHQGERIPGADDHYKPAGGIVHTVEAAAK